MAIYLHSYSFLETPLGKPGFPRGSVIKNPPALRETQAAQVQSLGQEDPLEEEMVTHSSFLVWRILCIEEPGRLQAIGPQRVGHDRSDFTQMHGITGARGSPEFVF